MNFFTKTWKAITRFLIQNFFIIANSVIVSSSILFIIQLVESFLITHMHITLAIISILLICFFFTMQYVYKNTRRTYKFNVNWDSQARPHCIHCDSALTYDRNPKPNVLHASLDFYCFKCKIFIPPFESKSLFDAQVAIQIMKERLQIPLDEIPFQHLRD